MEEELKLYYVHHTDAGGDDYDLLVGARNADEVLLHWRGYYHLKKTLPMAVFLVSPPTEAGPLGWHREVIEQVTREHAIKEAVDALCLGGDDAGDD